MPETKNGPHQTDPVANHDARWRTEAQVEIHVIDATFAGRQEIRSLGVSERAFQLPPKCFNKSIVGRVRISALERGRHVPAVKVGSEKQSTERGGYLSISGHRSASGPGRRDLYKYSGNMYDRCSGERAGSQDVDHDGAS